ncbi:MAG: cyclin-dependent kinase inhibitor 3 family protein [Deltaproteobacteria bacterium]|nr:cyclin-dependent kinase inhibitor 3 family protein [Deltaproteobacteria bacterium]
MTRFLKGLDVRTSESHPIRVDFTDMQPWAGRLGITFAPGKKNESYSWFRWERDLDLDLDRMRAEYGIEVVVTLVEEDEMEWMGIEELGDEVKRRGMEWLWFPIEDLGVPPGERFVEFLELAGGVIERLEQGRAAAVHCRGGLGRAGMVAACLLALKGIKPEEAIRCVRRARGEGAVEMPEQEEFVEEVASVGLEG